MKNGRLFYDEIEDTSNADDICRALMDAGYTNGKALSAARQCKKGIGVPHLGCITVSFDDRIVCEISYLREKQTRGRGKLVGISYKVV